MKTVTFFDELQKLQAEHYRVLALLQKIRDERDQYRTVLETLAAAVRDPSNSGSDLCAILCEQLQENGFDTTTEED